MLKLYFRGISGRIILGFSLIFLTAIAALGITLYNLNHVAASFNMNYNQRLPAQLNIAKLEKMVVDMETGLRGYLLTADAAFLEPYDLVEDEVILMIAETKRLLGDTDPQLKQDLSDIETLLGQWDNDIAGVAIVLMQEDRVREAHAMVKAGEGKRIFDAMRLKFTNLHHSMNRVTAGHFEEINALVLRSNHISMWMIGLLLVLVVIIFWQVFRYFNQRLATIAKRAEQVASGSFDAMGLQVHDAIDDELSPVMQSLRDIDQAFHAMTLQANHVAQGNYATDIKLRSTKDEMGLAMQRMVRTLRDVVEVVGQVAEGDLQGKVPVKGKNDLLAPAINSMTSNLQRVTAEAEKQLWLQKGVGVISDAIRTEQDLAALSRAIIAETAQYLNMQFATLYYIQPQTGRAGKQVLKLIASHGYMHRKNFLSDVQIGESLVGQAALELKPIVLAPVPSDYVQIKESSTGDLISLHSLLLVPFCFEGEVKGVIELGSLQAIDMDAVELLASVGDMITIAFNAVDSRTKLDVALAESQTLTQELQQQQRILQTTNQVLADQALTLEKAHEQAEERNIQLEEAQIELNKHAQDLALASQYKSEFLANMSHELRTPLNSILLLSHMLAEGRSGAVNADQCKQARVIHSAGSDLLQLINEILDLSKIEAGKMSVTLRDVDLHPFTQQFLDMFSPLAENSEIDFNIHIDDDLPTLIHTDPERVQQVLRNFLSNAFKFTEQGQVGLHVGKVSDQHIAHIISEKGIQKQVAQCMSDYIIFSIADTGKGISEGSRARIFEAFQQEDGSISRRYGGTGLGLSISKAIAQMLSGAIMLQSFENKGSTFALIIPTHLEHVSPSIELSSHKTASSRLQKTPLAMDISISNVLKNTIILLADDDVRNTFALCSLLLSHGAVVRTAHDGRDALDKLDKDVNLILMDIMMPDMDGYEAMRRIRSIDAYVDIPIIAITAKVMPGDEAACLAAGASTYIAKPINTTQLLKTIQHLLLVVRDDLEGKNIV